MTCLTEERILAVIDGGVAPNDLVAIDAHLAGCAACRALRLELEELIDDVAATPERELDAHVAQVMARLEEPRATPSAREASLGNKRNATPRWMVGSGVAAALALAASIFLVVRGDHQAASEFTARGVASNDHSLARDVGVQLLTLGAEHTLEAVAPDARLAATASFTGAYTNLRDAPAYLLLFGVDSAGDVHWLYPAYVSTHDDPSSAVLAPSRIEVSMPTSVVLEAPASSVQVITWARLRAF